MSVRSVSDGRNSWIVKTFRLADRSDATVTLLYNRTSQTADQLPVWDVLTRREQDIA